MSMSPPQLHLKGSIGMVVISGMLLTGCISHRAEVTSTAQDELGDWALLVDDQALPAGATFSDDSGLPLEHRVTAWRRTSDGRIWRGEYLVQTPLAWWQRFPLDFVVDLQPFTATALANWAATGAPVRPMPVDELTARAQAFGYAGEAPDRTDASASPQEQP